MNNNVQFRTLKQKIIINKHGGPVDAMIFGQEGIPKSGKCKLMCGYTYLLASEVSAMTSQVKSVSFAFRALEFGVASRAQRPYGQLLGPRRPGTATWTFTQLLSSVRHCLLLQVALAHVHRDDKDY